MLYLKSILCGLGGLILGAMLGWLLWFFVSIFMGAGHGTYLPAKLLFPYTMATTRWTHEITNSAIGAGWSAYAGYGALLGSGWPTAQRKRVGLVVLGLHALAAIVCLILSHSAF